MNTRKFIVLMLTLIIILLLPNAVQAHSTLQAAVPGEKTDQEVSEIQLTFNEDIEPVSKVVVTNEAGEEQPMQDIRVDGNVLTAVLEKPLTNGSYTVEWKIISADGHPLSGSYAMLVDAPIKAPEATPNPTPEATPQATSEPANSPSAQPTEHASSPSVSDVPEPEKTEKKSGGNRIDFSVIVLIGAALLLVAGVISAIVKRKQDKSE